MRRALIGLAVTTFTVLALAGPASAAPGQVTQFRFNGTFAMASWFTSSATSSTNTAVTVSSAKQGAELIVDQFTVNLDANGNITGATDTSADVTSGFSFTIDKGQLTSASTSGPGLLATACTYDANLNLIGCSPATIDVAATWTGQGPISRSVSNQRVKTSGFSLTLHSNGTNRAATATWTGTGGPLGASELIAAQLGFTNAGTIQRCIGLSC